MECESEIDEICSRIACYSHLRPDELVIIDEDVQLI